MNHVKRAFGAKNNMASTKGNSTLSENNRLLYAESVFVCEKEMNRDR